MNHLKYDLHHLGQYRTKIYPGKNLLHLYVTCVKNRCLSLPIS